MELDLNNKSVQNVLLRQKAKEIWRANRRNLLLLMAVALGITYGLQCLVSLIDQPRTVLYTASGNEITYQSDASFAATVASWAVSLLTAPLLLGLTCCMIDYARGCTGLPVSSVFGRMGIFLKAVGLDLLILLKTLAWMLPGMSLGVLLTIIEEMIWDHDAVAPFLMASYALMIVLPILASMRYALATHFLADDATLLPGECIAHSKQVMKGRKWQRFKLDLPYAFQIVGMLLGVTFLAALVLTALGVAKTPAAVAFMSVLPYLALAACVGVMTRATLAIALFYVQFSVKTADTIRHLKTRRRNPDGT